MFKRVFSKKSFASTSKSKSFRVPSAMLEKLETLAESQGETLNSYVVLILDQYLQVQAESEVNPPTPNKDEVAS
jgi:predicted HicB family RNase H-like nuclease